MDKPIPYYVKPLELRPSVIDEITRMVFGEPVSPERCDLIFVFGGSHPGLWETAADAFFRGLGRIVMATGGYKPTASRHFTWADGCTPESHVIRRELIRHGVPEDLIFYEDRSTNTLENVLFAQEVYDFSGVERILAVCKSYGVGRQCRTLSRHVQQHVKIIPYPFDTHIGGDGPFVTRENWMDFEKSVSYIFAQVLKIYQYGKMGHLDPVTHMSDALKKLVLEHFDK